MEPLLYTLSKDFLMLLGWVSLSVSLAEGLLKTRSPCLKAGCPCTRRTLWQESISTIHRLFWFKPAPIFPFTKLMHVGQSNPKSSLQQSLANKTTIHRLSHFNFQQSTAHFHLSVSRCLERSTTYVHTTHRSNLSVNLRGMEAVSEEGLCLTTGILCCSSEPQNKRKRTSSSGTATGLQKVSTRCSPP